MRLVQVLGVHLLGCGLVWAGGAWAADGKANGSVALKPDKEVEADSGTFGKAEFVVEGLESSDGLAWSVGGKKLAGPSAVVGALGVCGGVGTWTVTVKGTKEGENDVVKTGKVKFKPDGDVLRIEDGTFEYLNNSGDSWQSSEKMAGRTVARKGRRFSFSGFLRNNPDLPMLLK